MTTPVSAVAGITKPGITMQSAFNFLKTAIFPSSVRPEIAIHRLDHDFKEPSARPIIRSGGDAARKTVMPTEPQAQQDPSPPQGLATPPSYKTPSSSPASHDRQQSAVAGEASAVLSARATARCSAETFIEAAERGCLASVMRHIEAGLVNAGSALYEGTPLMHAAEHGHETIVRRLLEAGACVNRARTDGWTALMLAADKGDTAIVQALLDKGAVVDHATIRGETALIAAAAKGHTATVQALLDRGARVDKAINGGWTALMYATGHIATVRLLLKTGANCRLKDTLGDTALDLAIKQNHTEVIQLLRAHEAGARP